MASPSGVITGTVPPRSQFIKAYRQVGTQLIAFETPDGMIRHRKIQVKVASASGPWLEVALSLQPQTRSSADACGNAHLNPLIVHGEGALRAAERLQKSDGDTGLRIQIDGRARGLSPPGKSGCTGRTTKTPEQIVDEVIEVPVAPEIHIESGPRRTASHATGAGLAPSTDRTAPKR